MEYKRLVSEIIFLYQLEPNIKDIYVEGITDKLILERFFKKYDINDVIVKNVDDIEFSEIYDEYPEIRRNNKKKLIALCDELYKYFKESLNGIAIILDRDFDEIKDDLIDNCYIFYSDYNSLELYLFDDNVVNIFYNNYLNGFPYTGKDTLCFISPVLIEKFLIRLILDINGPFPKEKITDLSKSIAVNKGTGEIKFDAKSHLYKILNNIGKTSEKDFFLDQIEEFRKILSTEERKNIRGHDFIHLLFIFIDKIKNNIKLSEEAFEKCIFQCIDYSVLRKETLFSTLEQKYKFLHASEKRSV